ncbi:hypothetical protein HanRHA438_Chr08g0369751 [Helianthus annuus]|nr:hypothetical protein HanRHA438_Chr08g0369751 [Helianthus annuus]
MASVVGGGGLWRRWWVLVLLMNSARGDEMEKKNIGSGRNDFEGMKCLLEWVIPFH